MTANTARKWISSTGIALAAVLGIGCSDDPPDGEELFNDFCAECHGINNAGTTAANPVPVNLATVQAIKDAIELIPAMSGRSDLDSLSTEEIQAIADYIPTTPNP